MKLTEIKEYFDIDKTQLMKHFFINSDNKKHGAMTAYFTDGSVRFSCAFNNGEFHGEYKEYYRNGQLSSIYPYADGLIHGVYRTFMECGTPLLTSIKVLYTP